MSAERFTPGAGAVMLRVPMSRIIVCQHVAYEILGTLNPLLKEAGLRLRYVNFERAPGARPTLDGYDGVAPGNACQGPPAAPIPNNTIQYKP